MPYESIPVVVNIPVNPKIVERFFEMLFEKLADKPLLGAEIVRSCNFLANESGYKMSGLRKLYDQKLMEEYDYFCSIKEKDKMLIEEKKFVKVFPILMKNNFISRKGVLAVWKILVEKTKQNSDIHGILKDAISASMLKVNATK